MCATKVNGQRNPLTGAAMLEVRRPDAELTYFICAAASWMKFATSCGLDSITA